MNSIGPSAIDYNSFTVKVEKDRMDRALQAMERSYGGEEKVSEEKLTAILQCAPEFKRKSDMIKAFEISVTDQATTIKQLQRSLESERTVTDSELKSIRIQLTMTQQDLCATKEALRNCEQECDELEKQKSELHARLSARIQEAESALFQKRTPSRKTKNKTGVRKAA